MVIWTLSDKSLIWALACAANGTSIDNVLCSLELSAVGGQDGVGRLWLDQNTLPPSDPA